MNRDEWRILIGIAVCGLIMMSEFVACQWHADNLSGGCNTDSTDCLIKKAK